MCSTLESAKAAGKGCWEHCADELRWREDEAKEGARARRLRFAVSGGTGGILLLLLLDLLTARVRGRRALCVRAVSAVWRGRRFLLRAAVVIAVLCLLGFVWPTPYRYTAAGSHLYRMNRFTGEVRVWDAECGWVRGYEQDSYTGQSYPIR